MDFRMSLLSVAVLFLSPLPHHRIRFSAQELISAEFVFAEFLLARKPSFCVAKSGVTVRRVLIREKKSGAFRKVACSVVESGMKFRRDLIRRFEACEIDICHRPQLSRKRHAEG